MLKHARVLLVGVVLAAVVLPASSAGAVAGYGDVAADRYFTAPVQWSVDDGITGLDGACFEPDQLVSRGEMAVWLWNMEGQPSAPAHGFDDVVDAGQQGPVSWLVEEGITTGTSDTTFSPDNGLKRGQFAAFLWRLAGKPQASEHSFVDVLSSWQQGPVSWLVEEEITTGTSDTTFSPDDGLTRAQLVTFLYRYKSEPTVTINPHSPTCATPSGTFKIVTAGSYHSCAVRTDDTITCWGRNDYGQTDAPSGTFKTVTTGGGYSCAVRTDDTITCWGSNDNTTRRGVDMVTPGVDVSCPAPTPAADFEIAVSQPDHHQPGFEQFHPLTLQAGTYRAVVCWHDDDDPVKRGYEPNDDLFWFRPRNERDNEAYWTGDYTFLDVALPAAVTGSAETTFVVPDTGEWMFAARFWNADWRLSLWRT